MKRKKVILNLDEVEKNILYETLKAEIKNICYSKSRINKSLFIPEREKDKYIKLIEEKRIVIFKVLKEIHPEKRVYYYKEKEAQMINKMEELLVWKEYDLNNSPN